MKKGELLRLLEKYRDFEEELVMELAGVYLKKVEDSGLSPKSVKSISERINTLRRESAGHYKKFNELIAYVEKSRKEEF